MKKFITLLKTGLNLPTDSVVLCPDEIKHYLLVAERQSVLPIVVSGLKKAGYSDLLTDSEELSETRYCFCFVQQNEAQKKIVSILDENRIQYILLKGSILREFYPHPSMRTCSDIDILVHENDINRTIKNLEKKDLFKYVGRAHHDVHLVSRYVHLEIHFSLMTNVESIDSVLKHAWDYAVHYGNFQYRFTTEFNLFYIVAHAAKHFIKGGGIGIRPLIDIWLLQQNTEYNEDEVIILCKQAGISGFYEACCNLLLVWFENIEHNENTRAFEELILSGGVFGSKHIRILSHGRNNKGKKYFVTRIFKKSKEIKERYPVCEKHPILVPFYQGVRWTHLLNPAKRTAIRQEIKHTKKIDPDEIEKYDKLLKSMGL